MSIANLPTESNNHFDAGAEAVKNASAVMHGPQNARPTAPLSPVTTGYVVPGDALARGDKVTLDLEPAKRHPAYEAAKINREFQEALASGDAAEASWVLLGTKGWFTKQSEAYRDRLLEEIAVMLPEIVPDLIAAIESAHCSDGGKAKELLGKMFLRITRAMKTETTEALPLNHAEIERADAKLHDYRPTHTLPAGFIDNDHDGHEDPERWSGLD